MEMLANILAVGCGGFIGAALRYCLSTLTNLLARVTTGQESFAFPVATFGINFLGCLAMGFLAFYLPHRFASSTRLFLFATTGVLGGFTTFSTFCLDTYNLFLSAQYPLAVLNLVLSVGICMAGLAAGVVLARTVLG